jgi:PAS domain S-box-containing protein
MESQKKIRLYFIVVTMAMIFLFPLSSNGESDSFPLHNPLIIKGDWAFPPYEYINDKGQPEGFNIDLTCAIMKELGLQYKIELSDWKSVMGSLESGKSDLVMGMMYSNERARIFRFGPIHGYIYQHVVYRKGDLPIRMFDQLKDKYVVVEDNTTSYELLHNAGYDSHVVTASNMNVALIKLSQGHFFAALCDQDMANEIIKKNHLNNLVVADLGLPPQEYRFVANNELLLNKIDRALYKLKKDGSYDKIYNKWLVQNKHSRLSHIVYTVLGVFIIVAIVLYMFNSLLRRKVKKANDLLERKNRRLALAIHAGGINVWGYSVSKKYFYNVESELFPSKGKPFEEELSLLHPDDQPKFKALFQELEEGIIPQKAVCFRIDRKHTGEWRYIDKEFAVIKSADGKVDTIIGSNKDVTEEIKKQSRIEELLQKYQTVFNFTTIGIQYFDENGILCDMNEAACELFGVNDKEMLIESHLSIYDNPFLKDHLDRNHPEVYNCVIEQNFDETKEEDYFTLSKRSGIFIIDTKVIPIYKTKGVLDCIIVLNRDITDTIRMQKLLKDSIRKMELAIQCSNLVYWEFDVVNKIFTLNSTPISSYEDKLKVPIDVMLKNFYPDDSIRVKSYIDEILQKQDRVLIFEGRLTSSKGWRYCTFTGTPFEKDDKTGLYTKYVGFTRDDTEMIKLNNEIREYAKKMNYVLRSSDVQTWSYDIASKTITIFSGVNEEGIKGSLDEYLEYVDPSERDEVRKLFTHLEKGEFGIFSTKRKLLATATKNQRSYVVNDGIPVKDNEGKVTGYFGLCRNITDLIEIQNRLEEEKEKALQADKLKSTFLANMSHEIRTPLNAIVGFSNLLEEVEDVQEKKDYINLINTNSDLLLRIINDILDLSKIESGVITLVSEEFDMVPFFNEFARSLAQRETNPDVELIIDNPYSKCMVYADSNRMAQILTNFTTNAIKYTPAGHIKIGYRCIDNGIRLFVEDTGIGIAKDKQDRIFHRFEKLDDFAQGTGLGLSICKAICDAYNAKVKDGNQAKIGFESEEGKGSTFWVWIPCDPQFVMSDLTDEDISPVDNKIMRNNNTSKINNNMEDKSTILVAEDNDSNYLLVQALLKKYSLTHARNGLEAVNFATENQYDLILMDIKMPIMDGLEATKRIREFNKTVPIITLTAYAFDQDRKDSLAAGSNDFITKPLRKDELLAKVEKYINSQE